MIRGRWVGARTASQSMTVAKLGGLLDLPDPVIAAAGLAPQTKLVALDADDRETLARLLDGRPPAPAAKAGVRRRLGIARR